MIWIIVRDLPAMLSVAQREGRVKTARINLPLRPTGGKRVGVRWEARSYRRVSNPRPLGGTLSRQAGEGYLAVRTKIGARLTSPRPSPPQRGGEGVGGV